MSKSRIVLPLASSDIFRRLQRTYRVRESKHIVVVSDINGHKAGDVDPGRAWRKKRPSNVVSIS